MIAQPSTSPLFAAALAPAVWGAVTGLLFIADRAIDWSPVIGFAVAFAAVVIVVIAAGVGATCRADSGVAMSSSVVLGVALLLAAWGIGWPTPIRAALGGLGLLLAATAVGAVIGWRVEQRSYVWPLVIVAAAADIWSVTAPAGMTHDIVEGTAPTGFQALLLSAPVPGVGVEPIIGAGDLVFAALLLAATRRLSLSPARAITGLAIGFLACLVALLYAETPLPALPFIGLGAAAALGRDVRPRARELALAIGFASIFGVAAFIR